MCVLIFLTIAQLHLETGLCAPAADRGVHFTCDLVEITVYSVLWLELLLCCISDGKINLCLWIIHKHNRCWFTKGREGSSCTGTIPGVPGINHLRAVYFSVTWVAVIPITRERFAGKSAGRTVTKGSKGSDDNKIKLASLHVSVSDGSREISDFRGIVCDFEEFFCWWQWAWWHGAGEEEDALEQEQQKVGCDWECPEFLDGGEPLLAAFMDIGSVMIKAEWWWELSLLFPCLLFSLFYIPYHTYVCVCVHRQFPGCSGMLLMCLHTCVSVHVLPSVRTLVWVFVCIWHDMW